MSSHSEIVAPTWSGVNSGYEQWMRRLEWMWSDEGRAALHRVRPDLWPDPAAPAPPAVTHTGQK